MQREVVPLQFLIKVAARCNLNCSYCYVFNKSDQSWRYRSKLMADATYQAMLGRIRHHCELSGQPIVRLMFHGGEPLLLGSSRFVRWIAEARRELRGTALSFAIQTNGTLIDRTWADVFAGEGVEVGISIDGPPEIHDLARVDHAGRGSYDDVVAGIEALHRVGVPVNTLTVIPLGVSGLVVYHHLRSLKPATVNFLFPDQTHDDIQPVRDTVGATPVADFLIPVADEWLTSSAPQPDVPIVRNIYRMLLGGESRSDMFGNTPLGFVVVEVDGEIEGLDALRSAGEGLSSTGLNVFANSFMDIREQGGLHASAIFDGLALPSGCHGCPEAATCAGGYLPHRYSTVHGFDNPSAWCSDILAIFSHIRSVTGVDVDESALRRQAFLEVRDASGQAVGSMP
jgi:uncharacterized protein